MLDNYWECWSSGKKWIVVKEKPDFSKPHSADVCIGNCLIHPLITPDILPLMYPSLYETTWGEYSLEYEEAILAQETEEQRTERLRRDAERLALKRVEAETQVRFIYSREMHDKSLRGVRRNEGPKKYDRPCKWMVGKERQESLARGEVLCCWAWEFKNPKTGKIEKPRTCMFQHPGEDGWRDEWIENPVWNPVDVNNRFANLRTSRK